MQNKQAFTLIELLVVVLIIGILAAVALPQYQKAVEKARMTEAIMLVRAITNAQQVYFMANAEYATALDQLDIEIPGTVNNQITAGRIQTKNFVYTPGSAGAPNSISLAQRIPQNEAYFIYATSTRPDKIYCQLNSSPTNIQKKLCAQLNNGTF